MCGLHEDLRLGITMTTKSKQVTRSQKGHRILNIINQNQTIVLWLPFETIVIMAS
jgi:hypothetical protein